MSGASFLSKKILSDDTQSLNFSNFSDSMFESKEAPLIGFMGCLCAFSAGWETPKILEWARASGFPWDEETCAFAFKNGHLEDLQ